jgi:hypothetical protein
MGIREVFEGNDTRCCNLKGFSSVDDSIHVRERQSVTGDIDLGTGLNLSRNRGQKPFIHSTLYTTRNEEEVKAVNWGLSIGMSGGIAEFLLDIYRQSQKHTDAAYRTHEAFQVCWSASDGSVHA